MRRKTGRRFHEIGAVVVCATAAGMAPATFMAEVSAAPAHLPLRYAACPAVPGDPAVVVIAETPKGVAVTFERPDLGAAQTRDVNLAFVSRRLFFKLRTADELIEFQGRAGDRDLSGRLVDAHGARDLRMGAAPSAGTPMSGNSACKGRS